jgi:hypothetical protein
VVQEAASADPRVWILRAIVVVSTISVSCRSVLMLIQACFSEDLQAHVAAALDPFVGLFVRTAPKTDTAMTLPGP